MGTGGLFRASLRAKFGILELQISGQHPAQLAGN